MKSYMSADYFKIFAESLSIVKKCSLNSNDEAFMELNNGNKFSVTLMMADTGYPKQVMNIIMCKKSDTYSVIMAPYISEQTSNMCKGAGIGYLDMAGNCYIAYESLYIEIKGNKNSNVSKRGLKSIYERSSIVSSIILRILLADVEKSWKIKELANAAGCSIGQVSKVKDFLINQAYIEQTSDGITVTEPRLLMRNWAEVYGNNGEKKIECYSLDSPAILEAKVAKLKEEIGVECFLTGFSGGSRYQPIVRYQKVHAYVKSQNLQIIIDYLGLKKVDSGANVVLVIPYDDCVTYNSKIKKDNMIVSPVQLYLDCMGIKGRGEEMAEAILEREICK